MTSHPPSDDPRPADPHDIRMRGFAERSRVEDLWHWIDEQVATLPGETVPLDRLAGRVLADDVVSTRDVPDYERASMDGYAIRGEESHGASSYNPIGFRIVGGAFPGQPFEGHVASGMAVRIMTGAPLPRGADAVLPAEHAMEMHGVMEAVLPIPPGKNVATVGEDVCAGATVLRKGRVLRPQDIALLATLGITSTRVVREPKVRILATGNELVAAGEVRQPFQTVDANTPMLESLVHRDGGCVVSTLRVGDNEADLEAALTAADAEVILITGGSSVGAEDLAPGIVRRLGELSHHGVAMRPSSPTGLGRVGTAYVFLLPGNPVSCLCAYDFFARRALRKLAGRSTNWPYRVVTLPAGQKFVSTVGRLDYARVQIRGNAVLPISISGASILSSATQADGFVLIPAEREGYPPGTLLDVYLYD